MEPEPTVQVPATGPVAAVFAVFAVAVLLAVLGGFFSESAGGVLPLKKWM
jgi:hypothetical protein